MGGWADKAASFLEACCHSSSDLIRSIASQICCRSGHLCITSYELLATLPEKTS